MSDLILFHNLVNLAAADRKFTDEELEFLAARAEAWGIPTDEFDTAIAGIASGQLEVVLPQSKAQRVELLSEMIRLMAADGELAEIEKRLCAAASAQMQFSTEEFQQILDRVINA